MIAVIGIENVIYQPNPQCSKKDSVLPMIATIDEHLNKIQSFACVIACNLEQYSSDLAEKLGEVKII